MVSLGSLMWVCCALVFSFGSSHLILVYNIEKDIKHLIRLLQHVCGQRDRVIQGRDMNKS